MRRKPFVTIYQPIGGWNSVVYHWVDMGDGDGDGDEVGYWEPWGTGYNNTLGKATREGAIDEMICWALSEELDLALGDTKLKFNELAEEARVSWAESGAEHELDSDMDRWIWDWLAAEIRKRLNR